MRRCRTGKTCVAAAVQDVNVPFIYAADLSCRLMRAGTASFRVGVAGGPSPSCNVCAPLTTRFTTNA